MGTDVPVQIETFNFRFRTRKHAHSLKGYCRYVVSLLYLDVNFFEMGGSLLLVKFGVSLMSVYITIYDTILVILPKPCLINLEIKYGS